jgi:hypothetical protein
VNISAPFIARPVATVLLTIGLALGGAAAFNASARGAAAEDRRARHLRFGQSARRQSGSDGCTVATPLERHLGAIADVDDMTSTSNVGSTQHPADVRYRPRHRRRRPRRAGRDRRRACRSALGADQQSLVSQGQQLPVSGHDHSA